ncbi:MAG: Asp-tRNA(Asn)/Glu-tRNA(Gln) amidotransferase subunit GatC [Bacteriovoracia bacterium]
MSQALDITRKVADLARLELSASEFETYSKQLGDILTYVERLKQVDVTGVEPMLQPHADQTGLRPSLRGDVVEESPRDADGRPTVLAGGPVVTDDAYQVPPIL